MKEKILKLKETAQSMLYQAAESEDITVVRYWVGYLDALSRVLKAFENE